MGMGRLSVFPAPTGPSRQVGSPGSLQPFQPQWTGLEAANFSEVGRSAWLAWMRTNWAQGEHVTIMGRTGRGKTLLARDLLACRGYVCALAIKRADDTLSTFPKAGYRLLVNKRWPPSYGTNRVLYWAKPKSLEDTPAQQKVLKRIFDDAYINGGWTLFHDDVAYIANALGFRKTLAILINQARSNHSSQVCAMTQPSSVAQAIPSELWRQTRFHLALYYRTGRDLDAISDMVGYKLVQVKQWMAQLRPYDFLCFDDLNDQVFLVRSGL